MNTPLKFDPQGRPKFDLEHSDTRSFYDHVVRDLLLSIWRHKYLITLLVVSALVLAALLMPLIPRKYSAEALIYPNLFAQGPNISPLASVDAAALVTSEARLLRSDVVLRAVVKQLGLDHEPGPQSWSTRNLGWLKVWLFPETRNDSSFDRSVSMLRDKVVVMNDTRSYLISISFAASSAEEAARVVNAFAIEYLRDKAIQRTINIVNDAQSELARQLSVYGDKHPKTLQAAERVEAARASLKTVMSPQYQIAQDESVKLAVPNRTPTSPKGIVVLGLSVLSTLVAGIGLAIWRDRAHAKRKQTASHQPHLE